tara:strand:- start:513 stop:2276 length:1764 start_codon:yes stop_codon:yes gene_type:complete
MTVTQPSQDPNKDSATSAWEEQVTETTNRIQYQIDNINESVSTATPVVAIYSDQSDGTIQSFEPNPSGDGYVTYYSYSEYPTLPIAGLTFTPYSNDPVDFKIRQYIERAVRPTTPTPVTYTTTNGSWSSSTNWTKTKLVRGATNIWYCEANIVGTAGAITATWSNPRLLYGGQVGSGILYYNTAEVDGSAPGKPLANGYDFDANAFNGLRNASQQTGGTNNWVYNPISVTVGGADSIDKKHWQSSYSVEVSEITENTTTISGGVLAEGATTVTVANTEDFPIPSVDNTPLTIYIEDEQITYTGVTNTTFTGCLRGQNSTSDVEHANSTVVTSFIPTQLITFGTPVGFVPIGSNLQSDNFETGNTGWQIQRGNGNAEFNNVTARGVLDASSITTGTLDCSGITVSNLNAGSITAGNIAAARIASTTINADNISGGTLNITGLTALEGQIYAPNLAVGVILQVVGAYGVPIVGLADSGTTTIANTTFTSTNDDDFDTDAVAILVASAVCTSGGTGANVSCRFMQSTTVKLVTTVASADTAGSSQTRTIAGKIQLAKNTVYHCDVSWNNASTGTFSGGSGSVIVLEVRRV